MDHELSKVARLAQADPNMVVRELGARMEPAHLMELAWLLEQRYFELAEQMIEVRSSINRIIGFDGSITVHTTREYQPFTSPPIETTKVSGEHP